MANYRGVDKSVLVETIENAMDYVLRQNFNMAAKRHFDAWIDGTKLNILKQSCTSEELARNMKLTGAENLFKPLSNELNAVWDKDISPSTQKLIKNLKKWSAF